MASENTDPLGSVSQFGAFLDERVPLEDLIAAFGVEGGYLSPRGREGGILASEPGDGNEWLSHSLDIFKVLIEEGKTIQSWLAVNR